MVYRTNYLNSNSVSGLCDTMDDWFDKQKELNPALRVDNIAYMQEMKVQRLNPQISMVEFCCIITFSP